MEGWLGPTNLNLKKLTEAALSTLIIQKNLSDLSQTSHTFREFFQDLFCNSLVRISSNTPLLHNVLAKIL